MWLIVIKNLKISSNWHSSVESLYYPFLEGKNKTTKGYGLFHGWARTNIKGINNILQLDQNGCLYKKWSRNENNEFPSPDQLWILDWK